MTETTPHHGSRQYLHILRQHVLEPLSTAERKAKQERDEIDLESEAFEQFATLVEEISTDSPKVTVPAVRNVIDEPSSKKTGKLRKAYRDTVMNVPHYDDVYGEGITENLTAEFSPELAGLLQPNSGISFTAHNKDALIAAAEQSAEERSEFRDSLESELDSLELMKGKLTMLLENLDSSIVPAWYYQEFDDQLGTILRTRQSTLGSRSSPSHLDGHDLCEYLYSDESWTYPVLTAVGRLLDSVHVRK